MRLLDKSFFFNWFNGKQNLADKRRRRQLDQADANLSNHIDSLGLKSVKAYQQWCADNGFSRRLTKSQSDRRKERQSVVVSREGTQTTTQVRDLSNRSTLELIFKRNLTHVDLKEKKHISLARAVARLGSIAGNDSKKAIERLRHAYEFCKKRKVKFLDGTHPSLPGSLGRGCSFLEALASVVAFSSDWIRPIEDWKTRTHNQRRQFESLLSHLFAAHKTPEFLYNTWFHSDFKKGLECQTAFVHVAAGHSIRKTKLPIAFTKKMSHHFLLAPKDSSFSQAIRWGQIHGLGGGPLLARAVMGSELGNEFANEDFWRTVLQWFINNPMFDRAMFQPAFDFLKNQKFGNQRIGRVVVQANGTRRNYVEGPEQPNLSMKGRTPTSLIRDIQQWHTQLQRVHVGNKISRRTWAPSEILELRLAEGEKQKSVWTIQELLGSEPLYHEGRAMNHCVGSYVGSCARRQTSIWSMRHIQDSKVNRLLTIEVNLPLRVICQARGKNNRAPKPNELKIIRRWAQLADLKVAAYLR